MEQNKSCNGEVEGILDVLAKVLLSHVMTFCSLYQGHVKYVFCSVFNGHERTVEDTNYKKSA